MERVVKRRTRARLRTAARMGLSWLCEVMPMLQRLFTLALLAYSVAADGVLPYLTGDSSRDGEAWLSATFVALGLWSWWLLAPLLGRIRSPRRATKALVQRMLASVCEAGSRSWIQELKKPTKAMILPLSFFLLFLLGGKIAGHGFPFVSVFVTSSAAFVLAWRLMRAEPRGGGGGGGTGLRRAAVRPVMDAVAPAPRAEQRHMGRVLCKLAHAASVAVTLAAAGILPLLTEKVTTDVFSIALVFLLFVYLLLAMGLLVLAVGSRDVPGTLEAEKAALVAAMALLVIAMSTVACYIIMGPIWIQI